MNTIGIFSRRWVSSCWSSGPDIPGIATSRRRQPVSLTNSDARNASADANASAAKPNCRNKSGSASRMDSSSSTTDTNDGSGIMNASSSCRARQLLAHWNRKQKGGTWTVIRLCPKTAVMSLDDGAADGEADTHAVAFRRVEGVEQLGQVLRVDADSGIAHAHPDTIAVPVFFGSDQQLPRAIVHGGHRIRGVADQV